MAQIKIKGLFSKSAKFPHIPIWVQGSAGLFLFCNYIVNSAFAITLLIPISIKQWRYIFSQGFSHFTISLLEESGKSLGSSIISFLRGLFDSSRSDDDDDDESLLEFLIKLYNAMEGQQTVITLWSNNIWYQTKDFFMPMTKRCWRICIKAERTSSQAWKFKQPESGTLATESFPFNSGGMKSK